jgi:hypothetical protein
MVRPACIYVCAVSHLTPALGAWLGDSILGSPEAALAQPGLAPSPIFFMQAVWNQKKESAADYPPPTWGR